MVVDESNRIGCLHSSFAPFMPRSKRRTIPSVAPAMMRRLPFRTVAVRVPPQAVLAPDAPQSFTAIQEIAKGHLQSMWPVQKSKRLYRRESPSRCVIRSSRRTTICRRCTTTSAITRAWRAASSS